MYKGIEPGCYDISFGYLDLLIVEYIILQGISLLIVQFTSKSVLINFKSCTFLQKLSVMHSLESADK